MNTEINAHNTSFYSIGVSYKKSDATTREAFSISPENQHALLAQAKNKDFSNVLLISTCNRTELYGFAPHPSDLMELLVGHAKGSMSLLETHAFVHTGSQAIQHLFDVGCGLDSQIIGDFEIIGQVKKSYENSIKAGVQHAFLDRLVRAVIQASRKIKRETNLSSGATSVSFAGVHYIQNQFDHLEAKNIVLFGTGKLGRNTCENLVKHVPYQKVTLVNRDIAKAEALSHKFDFNVKPQSDLTDVIADCDILFVSTGAAEHTITPAHITSNAPLLILDLSLPRNVDPAVGELPNVHLVHMDELSQIINKNLEQRSTQLPIAQQIMQEILEEFNEWVESRKMVPTIKALNQKLKHFKDNELQKMTKDLAVDDHETVMAITDKVVQKLTGNFAGYLRSNSANFEEDLNFIHQIFKLDKV